MAVTSLVPVSRPRGRSASTPATAVAARGLNTTASAAAQATRQQREGRKQRADVDEIARENRARDRHDQNRNDSEQAIHQHRCHRINAADTFFRQPVRAHGVAADACGQKRADERADEEDPHDGRQAAGRCPGSSGASSVHHRYAINTRSIATSAHASRMNRQSAPRAACHTARGSLCQSRRAVRPAATMTRATRAKPPGRVAVVVFCCRVLVPVSIVAICTGIVAVIIAGPWALAYIPLYVLATFPAGLSAARCSAGIRPPGSRVRCSGTPSRAWRSGPCSRCIFRRCWRLCSRGRWCLQRRGPPSRLRRSTSTGRSLNCRPGARPRRARSCCYYCWYRPCSSCRTRISARAMLKAIVFTARTSPPISSGTWRSLRS